MRIISCLAMLVFLASCATPTTTPPFSVSSENAWFLEQDMSTHTTKPMYCISDVKEGKASPKCYKAKTIQ